MLIDKTYIVQRLDYLIKEKQQVAQPERAKADKLFRIKDKFPEWLRSILFHPFNPAYSVFVQYKASKKKGVNQINLETLHPYAVDFLQYCLTNDICFKTDEYYPEEDEDTLETFIDNRLKSIISGYECLSLTLEQQKMSSRRKAIYDVVSRTGDGYTYSLDGDDFYLPGNSFAEYIFIHEYGLIYLPDYVREYIKGKVFLDIGAYIGDTAIFFQKKYHPDKIYAYEPVRENAEQLEKTVSKNNTDRIIVVQKGIGDKEEGVDIHINPSQMSSCSVNDSVAKSNLQTEKRKIYLTTIDHECQNHRVGLIKMDIEGAEFSAIKGGLETIKRDKPVLLISLYHTGKDFFEIPPILKSAVPQYQFRFLNIGLVDPLVEKILVAYPKV